MTNKLIDFAKLVGTFNGIQTTNSTIVEITVKELLKLLIRKGIIDDPKCFSKNIIVQATQTITKREQELEKYVNGKITLKDFYENTSLLLTYLNRKEAN